MWPKDFENFLFLSMIVSFALTLLSRCSSSWLNLIYFNTTYLNGLTLYLNLDLSLVRRPLSSCNGGFGTKEQQYYHF